MAVIASDSAWKRGRKMARLSDELRGLPGGQKYVKTKDLTREVLLEYAKRQQGAVVAEVDLISVTALFRVWEARG
jgi:hypothetical protein